MKKKSAFLISLLVGMCLFPPKGMASAISEITADKTNLAPAFELAKIENAYKVAGVCFLGVGDCNDSAGYGQGDEDYTMDTAARALLLITVTLFKSLKVTVLTTSLTSRVVNVPQTS